MPRSAGSTTSSNIKTASKSAAAQALASVRGEVWNGAPAGAI